MSWILNPKKSVQTSSQAWLIGLFNILDFIFEILLFTVLKNIQLFIPKCFALYFVYVGAIQNQTIFLKLSVFLRVIWLWYLYGSTMHNSSIFISFFEFVLAPVNYPTERICTQKSVNIVIAVVVLFTYVSSFLTLDHEKKDEEEARMIIFVNFFSRVYVLVYYTLQFLISKRFSMTEEAKLKDESMFLVEKEEEEVDFMQKFSHFTRVELNGIVGCMPFLKDSLSKKEIGRDCVVDCLYTLGFCSEEIQRQILDLVEYFIIGCDRFDISIQPKDCDVREVIRQVVKIQKKMRLERDKFKRSSVKIFVKTPQGFPQKVMVDCQRLSQCLNNVVSNSIKYTDRGEIVIDLTDSFYEYCHPPPDNDDDEEYPPNYRLVIKVMDTGHGIDPLEKKDLFKPFHNIENRKSNEHSFSVGLHIIQKIIEKMGGTFDVDSKGIGKGTKATIDIPVRVPNSNTEKYSDDDEEEVEEEQEWEGEEAYSQSSEKNNKIDDVIEVILVEDDPINRHVFKRQIEAIFGKERCRIHEASNGKMGYGIFVDLKERSSSKGEVLFPIILTDMNMPEANGIELSKAIRYYEDNNREKLNGSFNSQSGRTNRIKRHVIHMINGMIIDEETQKKFFDDHLLDGLIFKPVQIEQMKRILKKCIQMRNERLESPSSFLTIPINNRDSFEEEKKNVSNPSKNNKNEADESRGTGDGYVEEEQHQHRLGDLEGNQISMILHHNRSPIKYSNELAWRYFFISLFMTSFFMICGLFVPTRLASGLKFFSSVNAVCFVFQYSFFTFLHLLKRKKLTDRLPTRLRFVRGLIRRILVVWGDEVNAYITLMRILVCYVFSTKYGFSLAPNRILALTVLPTLVQTYLFINVHLTAYYFFVGLFLIYSFVLESAYLLNYLEFLSDKETKSYFIISPELSDVLFSLNDGEKRFVQIFETILAIYSVQSFLSLTRVQKRRYLERKNKFESFIEEKKRFEERTSIMMAKTSHDLATPATALSSFTFEIFSYLDDMDDEDEDEVEKGGRIAWDEHMEEKKKYLNYITRCVTKMEVSINNFLALCKIRNRKIVSRIESGIDFGEFLNEVIQKVLFFSPDPKKKKNIFKVQLFEEECDVDDQEEDLVPRFGRKFRKLKNNVKKVLNFDYAYIGLIITNLLSNSLVHSESDFIIIRIYIRDDDDDEEEEKKSIGKIYIEIIDVRCRNRISYENLVDLKILYNNYKRYFIKKETDDFSVENDDPSVIFHAPLLIDDIKNSSSSRFYLTCSEDLIMDEHPSFDGNNPHDKNSDMMPKKKVNMIDEVYVKYSMHSLGLGLLTSCLLANESPHTKIDFRNCQNELDYEEFGDHNPSILFTFPLYPDQRRKEERRLSSLLMDEHHYELFQQRKRIVQQKTLNKKWKEGIRILCFDDDIMILNFCVGYLHRIGFSMDNIQTTSNLPEATSFLMEDRDDDDMKWNYDVLFIDFKLGPQIRTFDFFQLIHPTKLPPFIVLITGSTLKEIERDSYNTYMMIEEGIISEHVEKPMSFPKLQFTVKKVLERD